MSENKNGTALKGAVVLRLGDILQDSDGILSLVKLNLLFIITCLPFIPFLPVLTAGPSIKALLHCTNRLVKTGYLPDVKNTYMEAYKAEKKESVRAGAAVVIVSLVFTLGLYFYLVMAGNNIIYAPFASVSLLVIVFAWSITAHFFPALTDNDQLSYREKVNNAMVSAYETLPKTLIAVVISLIFIAGQILFLPASLPLVFTLGFSVPALCCAFAHTEPEFI
ncbi:MAG: DUF624 domain-containing protein [Oscillospiraceae bacterium]|nr:DUF624 domain-containing protein [Oscillospiraceae bacterium]